MAMLDPEVYIDAGIAWLRNGLSASIDTENALHSDFPIAKPLDQDGNYDPSRILFGGEDDTDTIVAYPAIVFAVPDIARTGMSIGLADWDVAPNVIVQAFIEQDQNVYGYQRLYRAVIRFARAINRVMLSVDPLTGDGAFGGTVTIVAAREAHRVNPADPAQHGNQRTAFCLLSYTLDGSETAG